MEIFERDGKMRSYRCEHSTRRRNAIKWLFSDLKTFIWSINADIILAILFAYINSPNTFHISIHFGAYLNQWTLNSGHCVVPPISTYSYQPLLLLSEKLVDFGLRLNRTKGINGSRVYFSRGLPVRWLHVFDSKTKQIYGEEAPTNTYF